VTGVGLIVANIQKCFRKKKRLSISHRYYLEVAIAEHMCNGYGSEEIYDSLDDSALMWIP
jgi:hypothetical protein